MRNIPDSIEASGSFQTLAALLRISGLWEALRQPGPFTLLAPVDDAFAALPAGTVDLLLNAEPATAAMAVLSNHLLLGRLTAARIRRRRSVGTLLGCSLPVTANGAALQVGQANVLRTDLPAANGLIHVVDTVLMPDGEAKAFPKSGHDNSPEPKSRRTNL
jgi:uncharacterized surface protein with fasciclin (FAS1) repeats